MSPEINLGGASNNTLGRISYLEYCSMRLDAASLVDAVLAIEDPHDALNFAIGLADLSEAEGESDYIYSGAYASSTIRNAIQQEIGPQKWGSSEEELREKMDLWGPVLECVIKAKETPCMWSCLKDGRDFEEVSKANDGMYYPRNFFEAASKQFRQAAIRLEFGD